MNLTAEERKAVVATRLEKALRAYEEAKGVVPLKYWETAANRLDYAAYDAVSALLIAHGEQPQTHSGVIRLLGMIFIKSGILDAEIGKLYHKLFSMRQTGDYDDTYGLTEEDVVPYVEPTGQLIEKVSGLAKEMVGIPATP